MIQQTIQQLKDMKLFGFVQALDEQLHSATYAQLPFEERLSFLVQNEATRRTNNRISRYLKNAQLKQQAIIEDIDFNAPRGIKRSFILELATCSWITKKQNLIITGPTGAGKSFLACAFADAACRKLLSAKYYKTNHLIQDILVAKADGSYHKLCNALDKIQLLIIDEWLRDPIQALHAREILDILDDRYNKKSTIFVSQLPSNSWFKQIQDPTIADAILDRIIHNAHNIKIKGESMRKNKNINNSIQKNSHLT